MDNFSIGGAWSYGFRFFSQRVALHLLVLLGMGIVVPLALQFALIGQVIGMRAPLPGQGEAALAQGPLMGIVQIIGYFLQVASYFTSWRLGFSAGERLPRALLFGCLASLLTLAVFAIVAVPAGLAIGASMASDIPFLGLFVGLTAIAMVLATFYTLMAAVLATIAMIVLSLSMLLSALSGNVSMAAIWLGGGSGAVVVLFLVLSVILLWVATRLSCTTSVMADWKSYNLIAAIRESWHLTLEDQWAILRYLLLVAVALVVFIFVIALAAGVGAAAVLQGGDFAPNDAVAVLVFSLIFGIPFALLNVLVPAGIYRDLTRSSMAAEVFA